jgi:diguanylate cyclase (GGDEF)-like protein
LNKEILFLDKKTGLYSDQYFYIRLDEEIHRAERYQHFLSIATIKFCGDQLHTDSADSKTIDKSGLSLLERLMPQIGFLLKKHLRKVDIITRTDNPGFHLILPETPSEGASILQSRTEENLTELLWGLSKRKNYQVKVGIATYPIDARNYKELVEKAAPT